MGCGQGQMNLHRSWCQGSEIFEECIQIHAGLIQDTAERAQRELGMKRNDATDGPSFGGTFEDNKATSLSHLHPGSEWLPPRKAGVA